MTDPARVIVVDDQTLVRSGIRSLLAVSESVEVVGEAADGEEALGLVDEADPDVVLLDLRMPVLDGLGFLRRLRERDRRPAVVVLTTFNDDESLISAVRLGAQGFLLKDVSLDQLVATITDVRHGRSGVQPALTDALVRALSRQTNDFESSDAPEPLTSRESEIIHLLAGGYSNKEIAAALFLSTGTVKNHVSNVLLKLGVRDRTRAVLRAYELGLLGDRS